MTITKRSERTVTVCALVGILVVVSWLAVPITLAAAETVKFRTVLVFTKMERIPVGDLEGHTVGICEQTGMSSYENGETALIISRGTFDSMVGMETYCVQIFEDKSTQWLKIHGTCKPTEDENVFLFEGTLEFTSGTGRFEGIKGTGSFTGKHFGICRVVYFDCTASYTLTQH